MLKKDELVNPRSCLNQSQDDEPVFVLCARDVDAPAAVRHWGRGYVIRNGGKIENLTPRQRKKLAEAMDLALSMEAWQRENDDDG